MQKGYRYRITGMGVVRSAWERAGTGPGGPAFTPKGETERNINATWRLDRTGGRGDREKPNRRGSPRYNRFAAIRQLKGQIGVEDVDSIEVELGVEAALDIIGLAKTMLLAGEQEIAHMFTLAAEGLNHGLRLVRGHDRVFVALEEDHRLRQPVRMMDRRALTVTRLLLRIGPDKPVEIA